MSESVLVAAWCGVLGLLIGSFLNVVVWRVPRGESIVSPPSHCPRCDSRIAARDNIPVLSWLLLRGRCRHCGEAISARYPMVEILTAAVFAALGARFGLDAVLPAFLYLGAAGTALALIDLDTKRLPDVITLPSYPVAAALLAVAALAAGEWDTYLRALLGMAALYSGYFLVALISPRSMGFGDVKLAGVLGLYLGWLGWDVLAVGAFAGFFLGGVLGIALLAAKRATRKSAIPFGPFMLLGALLAVLAGEPLADLWLRT